MPAIVSHYVLAEKVIDALQESCPWLSINRTAFLWGATGPDIFFAHNILPWQSGKSLRTLSTLLHGYDAEKIINFFASYAYIHKSSIAMSYTLGFITHYAFDSTAHPYIVYAAEKLSQNRTVNSGVCHNEIEAALDTMYFRKTYHRPITSFPLTGATPYYRPANEVIAEMYHQLFEAEFQMDISADTMLGVQRDWYRGILLLTDRLQIKKKLVAIGETLIGLDHVFSPAVRVRHPDLSLDYANMHRKKWFSSADKKYHTENFFELSEQAIDQSLRLIGKLLSHQILTHEDCAYRFSGKDQ